MTLQSERCTVTDRSYGETRGWDHTRACYSVHGVLPLFMQQNSLLCFHVWPFGTDNTSYELGQFKNNPALTDDVKNVSHPAYQMADADNALQGYTNKL